MEQYLKEYGMYQRAVGFVINLITRIGEDKVRTIFEQRKYPSLKARKQV